MAHSYDVLNGAQKKEMLNAPVKKKIVQQQEQQQQHQQQHKMANTCATTMIYLIHPNDK